MSDYIRREDAIDLINKISNLDLKAKGGICVSLANLQKADVVQVVRCKECMHYVQETPYRGYCTDTHSFGRYWRPDDFCSYGEREE